MNTLMPTLLLLLLVPAACLADPCGMVPPIYQGPGVPITRVGEQATYVFHQAGIESIVIRPGFQGRVEEFGMLIPFPTAPAIRKVSDDIFPHIAAAIDPPEVVMYVGPRFGGFGGGGFGGRPDAAAEGDGFAIESEEEVRVLREEAVGMYEVAVLEAGSPAALKKWMQEHDFRFPDGMEDVCGDYVRDRWCFVAVKTKVGRKSDADPRPGQRQASPELPADATFDGHVQAMGFRFRTKELVVPMRLSAFNEGELRNIVYILTYKPQRIRNIPDEFVVRQLHGSKLLRNVTGPLPLRIVGGTVKELSQWQRESLPQQRDPHPHNGAARRLFAADLQAVDEAKLSLQYEETEKAMLNIGEELGLRGAEIDALNQEYIDSGRHASETVALQKLKNMTLTVVDGDFPRDVLASENLKFAFHRMPRSKNSSQNYDAIQKGPRPDRGLPSKSKLILESIGASQAPRISVASMASPLFAALLLLLAISAAKLPLWGHHQS